MKTAIVALVLLTLTATAAMAEIVNVSVIGTVEYNAVRSGRFATVQPGDAAAFTFTVDSNNFLNSSSYPTRGYIIDQASFLVTLGSVSAVLQSPFAGTPYFVVRNNDPAVDGFFLSLGTDFPSGLTLDVPANVAGTRFFESRFNVTYGGTRLSSLDILGALGTYDYTGLTVFGFAIDDLGNDPIGINFVQLVISAPVPVEDTTWGELKALYQQ
jgi:hypothetical protein